MEEKEMNRTVYPLRFKNKGWKIANKCAEIFIILLVAGAEAFFMALYSGWVLNLIEPGEPQVGDRILLLWPILPCIALLVALIVQLPKPKTIVLTDWSLSILRHNLMEFPYRWGFNESVSLSKIQRFEVKEYRRSDWIGRRGAFIPVVGWTGTAWYRFLLICVGIMCRWTIRRPLWRISPPAWKKRASTAALMAFGGIKRKIILSKIEYCKKTPQTMPLWPLGVFFYIKQGTVPCFMSLHSAGDGSRFFGFTALRLAACPGQTFLPWCANPAQRTSLWRACGPHLAALLPRPVPPFPHR